MTVHSRFQISHHEDGLIAATSSFGEAVSIAYQWMRDPNNDCQNKEEITIFDSMAHRHRPDTWAYSKPRFLPIHHKE